MAEKIGEDPQSQKTHGQQDTAREQRENGGGGYDLTRVVQLQLGNGTGRHQRYDRHWPDRQRPTGPENRVGHQRQDRCIEPHFGRDARQKRVGQRLWDQHHGDNDSRDAIAHQVGTTVLPTPIKDRHETPNASSLFGRHLAGPREHPIGQSRRRLLPKSPETCCPSGSTRAPALAGFQIAFRTPGESCATGPVAGYGQIRCAKTCARRDSLDCLEKRLIFAFAIGPVADNGFETHRRNQGDIIRPDLVRDRKRVADFADIHSFAPSTIR